LRSKGRGKNRGKKKGKEERRGRVCNILDFPPTFLPNLPYPSSCVIGKRRRKGGLLSFSFFALPTDNPSSVPDEENK